LYSSLEIGLYFRIEQIVTSSVLIGSKASLFVGSQALVLPVVISMSFIQLLQRSYKAILNPPDRGSEENAVRFGLLGASTIAQVPSRFLHWKELTIAD
jgi:hypothetical protein